MIKIIAAVGKNNELGNKGSLPEWKLSTDLQRFKSLTEGCPVVMGRKSYESLPEKYRPLPNRKNIVLTRDKSWKADGVETFQDIEDILEKYKDEKTLWIIGGGEIYKNFIDLADELHITHVEGDFPADTFFPEIPARDFKKFSEEKIGSDEKNSHNSVYRIYQR